LTIKFGQIMGFVLEGIEMIDEFEAKEKVQGSCTNKKINKINGLAN